MPKNAPVPPRGPAAPARPPAPHVARAIQAKVGTPCPSPAAHLKRALACRQPAGKAPTPHLAPALQPKRPATQPAVPLQPRPAAVAPTPAAHVAAALALPRSARPVPVRFKADTLQAVKRPSGTDSDQPAKKRAAAAPAPASASSSGTSTGSANSTGSATSASSATSTNSATPASGPGSSSSAGSAGSPAPRTRMADASLREALNKAQNTGKKGKLVDLKPYHDRCKTAYGYFFGGQGPHTMAHVTTQVGVYGLWHSVSVPEVRTFAQRMLCTKVIPRPGVVFYISKSLLREAEKQWAFAAGLKNYFDAYTQLYRQLDAVVKAPKSPAKKTTFELVSQLLELHPAQTYRWPKGEKATKEELDGKKENRADAIEDLVNSLDLVERGLLSNFKTVDSKRLTALYRIFVTDRLRNFSRAVLTKDPLSDTDEYSDSDEETTLADSIPKDPSDPDIKNQLTNLIFDYVKSQFRFRPHFGAKRQIRQALVTLENAPREQFVLRVPSVGPAPATAATSSMATSASSSASSSGPVK